MPHCITEPRTTPQPVPLLRLADLAIVALRVPHSNRQSAAVTDSGLSDLLDVAPRLRRLSLTEVAYAGEAIVAAMARRCHALELIDINRSLAMGDVLLQSLRDACAPLRGIALSRCGVELSDAGFRIFARSYSSLSFITRLEMTCCEGITAESIRLLHYFPVLDSLDLTGTAVHCPSDVLIAALGGGVLARRLQSLTLTAWRNVPFLAVTIMLPSLMVFVCDGATLAAGRTASPVGPLPLASLSLQWSTTIATDANIAALCMYTPSMTTLQLCGAMHFTDASLVVIASTLSCLQVLELTRMLFITDVGVSELAALSQLRILNLMGCSQVAASGAAQFQCMTSLEVLDLSGLDEASDSSSFYTLATLVEKRLHKLVLSANTHVTNALLDSLFVTQAGEFNGVLELLDLSMCWHVDDTAVDALCRATSLRWLDIGGSAISSDGAAAIKWGLPKCFIKQF